MIFFVSIVFRHIIQSVIWKARDQSVNIVVFPSLHSPRKACLENGVFIMAVNITRSATSSMQDHVVALALMSSVLMLKMAFPGGGLMMGTNSFMKSATRKKCLLKWEPSIPNCGRKKWLFVYGHSGNCEWIAGLFPIRCTARVKVHGLTYYVNREISLKVLVGRNCILYCEFSQPVNFVSIYFEEKLDTHHCWSKCMHKLIMFI